MIEFYGNLSRRCQKYILHKESKVGFMGGLIAAGIFTIPAIVLTIKVNIAFILCVPALLLIAFLAGCPPTQKNYNMIMPSKIIIDIDNGTVISKSEKFYLEYSVEDIVSINDMGEFYHIFFGDKVDRLGRFVCQIDLIHGCTLDEFEKIFELQLNNTGNGSMS